MIVNADVLTGVGIGTLSIAAAALFGVQQMHHGRTLVTSGYPIVPVAAEFLPPGSPPQPARPPLTPAQRDALRKALWREPLDQKLGNFVYVDTVQSGAPAPRIVQQAELLSRLGWRYTPAQQNLLVRAAFDGRFAEVVDRADGLLRRQKLTPLATAMLGAMETVPQVRGLVVAKLQARPRWRSEYLAAVNPQTPAAVIDARVGIMRVLLRDRDGVRRDEIVPLIGAMVATGKAPRAHALWQAYAKAPTGGNLLNDANFRHAAMLNAAGLEPVPFEWAFRQGLGYAASATSDGLSLSWDGRGNPLFMTQMVPLRAGGRYVLRIRAAGDAATTRQALAPTIICGATTVRFNPSDGGNAVEYRSEATPADCAYGVLSIVGNLDSGRRNINLMISEMALVPA